MDIECARMDNLFSPAASFLSPVGIEFDTAAITLRTSGDRAESLALADAGIERNETRHHLKTVPNAFGFWQRKRKIPETNASLYSHRGDYSFLPT